MKQITDLTIEELRNGLADFKQRIEENDGRLTTHSSADLDYCFDMVEKLEAEIKRRGDPSGIDSVDGEVISDGLFKGKILVAQSAFGLKNDLVNVYTTAAEGDKRVIGYITRADIEAFKGGNVKTFTPIGGWVHTFSTGLKVLLGLRGNGVEQAQTAKAVATLNRILSGKYTAPTEIRSALDQATWELEAVGLIEEYVSLLTQAAEYLAGVMRTVEAIHDPTSPEGYARVLADEALQLQYQDRLDSFFSERIVDVRNALCGKGWEGGERGTALVKQPFTLGHNMKQVGAGRNVVSVQFVLSGDGKEAKFFADDLTKTPDQLATYINAATAINALSTPDTKAWELPYKTLREALRFSDSAGRDAAAGLIAELYPDQTALACPWIQFVNLSQRHRKSIVQALKENKSVPSAVIADYPDLFLEKIRSYLPYGEYVAIRTAMKGEEKQFFFDKAAEIANIIDTMPKSYEQNGKGDAAVVYLHYFQGGSDWYITEKDRDPDGEGQVQAYGYTVVNGDTEMGDMDYINIVELVEAGVELDLYWKQQQTLGEVKGTTAKKMRQYPQSTDDGGPAHAWQFTNLFPAVHRQSA